MPSTEAIPKEKPHIYWEMISAHGISLKFNSQ